MPNTHAEQKRSGCEPPQNKYRERGYQRHRRHHHTSNAADNKHSDKAHSKAGDSKPRFPPQSVANQLNILIPSVEMTMVVIMKNIRNQPGMPLVNIWCAQTIDPKS